MKKPNKIIFILIFIFIILFGLYYYKDFKSESKDGNNNQIIIDEVK